MKTILATLCLSLLLSFSAMALTLKEAKQAGIIGEKLDGYIGIVTNHSQAPQLVATVNGKRLALYRRLAQKNKISIKSVAYLAAKNAIKKTAKGHYIEVNSGKWLKK